MERVTAEIGDLDAALEGPVSPQIAYCSPEFGIDAVLLTCEDGNRGSIGVIERNGGVLQDVIPAEGRDARIRRYWIRRGAA